MGNHVRFTRFVEIGIILAVSAIFFALPFSAQAASFWPGFPSVNPSDHVPKAVNDILRERLCDRQDRVGNRLNRLLINPSLCEDAPPPSPTPVVTLTASPTTISAGDSTTLSWSSSNADTCTAFLGWTGSKALSGSQVVSPVVTTTYQLDCTGPGGVGSDDATVTVNVVTPETPTVDISALPLSIQVGSSSQLTWNSENTTTCVASNGWSGARAVDGVLSVSPTVTTTYTLECTGAGGIASDSVTITVTAEPLVPTLTLNANPLSVSAGATSTLTWVSGNTTSCVASNGWTGAKALSGSLDVFPSATTTYQLDCTGAGGTISKSVTVNVSLASPQPTVTLIAIPSQVMPGAGSATSTLTWTSTHASSCTASGGTWTGAKALNGSEIVTPSATTTYMLECSGPGGTASASVVVNFSTALVPVVTLSATPSSVTPGAGSATTTLMWTSTNATSCTAFGGWTGSKGLSGSEIVTPVATTTYQLDCTGPGGVGSDDAVVNFVPTPSLQTISQIVVGDSRFGTLEAAVIAAELADDLAGEGPFTVFAPTDDAFAALPEGVLASLLAAPTTTLKDVLLYHVVSGNLDSTEVAALDTLVSLLAGKLLDVTVSSGVMINNALITIADIPASNGVIHVINAVLIPPATPTLSLVATPGAVTPSAGSATSTLSWTSTGALSCTASEGWTGARALNGSEIVTPLATTTYQLDCSGLGGNVSDEVVVNFAAAPVVPTLNHILISEVLDQPTTTAQGVDSTNEWIELYNPTASTVDLSFWTIKDATNSFDMIPNGTTIPAGGFLFLTNASTTPSFWSLPGSVQVIAFESPLGAGLNNTTESLFLRNAATTTIDSLSWGATTTAFVSGSGAPDVVPGHSLFRTSLSVDTDTAADWADDATPNPGVAN